MKICGRVISSKCVHFVNVAKPIYRSIASFGTALETAEVPKFTKYKYKGASETHSIIFESFLQDTSIWNEFTPHDGDIYVATPARCGTSLTQEIIGQLLYKGDYCTKLNITNFHEVSPWMAMRLPSKEIRLSNLENQLNNPNIVRRCIKLHEPIETIKYNPNCKYIFISRDYRDIIWSMYRFYLSWGRSGIHGLNIAVPDEQPELKIPTIDELTDNGEKPFTQRDLMQMNLTKMGGIITRNNDYINNNGNFNKEQIILPDGYPFFSKLWIVGSWWNAKQNLKLDNIMFIHFTEYKKDLRKMIIKISHFIEADIDINSDEFDKIVQNCSFESMKKHKRSPVHRPTDDYIEKPDDFFGNAPMKYKWEDQLTQDDIQQYKMVAQQYLDEQGIYWLENGTFM